MKVDLGFRLKMVKACDPGARLKIVKVPRLPDPYIPPVEQAGRKHVGSPGCVHEQACAQPMECLAKGMNGHVCQPHPALG